MQRKIFIGINLPQDVKKRLMQKTEKWKDLPIRWSAEDNLHLTLAFLGHIDDELIYEICSSVKRAAEEFEFFDVLLNTIETGPNRDEDARLIWFTGEPSEELKKLSEKIEEELGILNDRKKIFKPHITLGRIQKGKWEKLDIKPEIKESLTVLVPVESVQVFESAIIDGKRKFSVIDSCDLAF